MKMLFLYMVAMVAMVTLAAVTEDGKGMRDTIGDVEISPLGNRLSDSEKIIQLQGQIASLQESLSVFAGTERCPGPYTLDKEAGLCYRVHRPEDKVNWHLAQLICRSETPQGRLAVLDTEQKRVSVKAAIEVTFKGLKDTTSFYIGGRKSEGGSAFNWTTEQSMSGGTWCEGQPVPDSICTCASLWGRQDYCIDDVCCEYQRNFVCEKPM